MALEPDAIAKTKSSPGLGYFAEFGNDISYMIFNSKPFIRFKVPFTAQRTIQRVGEAFKARNCPK
jgi:hypothetical protein